MVSAVAGVTSQAKYLAQERPMEIGKRLQLVTDEAPFVQLKSGVGEFRLTARHGDQLTSHLRDWVFPSSVNSIMCQYGEGWKAAGSDDHLFMLDTVYFQLRHYLGEGKPREIVVFHWSPSNFAKGYGGCYNNQPHVHIPLAPEPLPKSHIGVTLTVDASGQSTIQYLDQLLDDVIGMVAVEILERIQRTPLGMP